MSDGTLSQDEIDALLSEATGGLGGPSASTTETSVEVDDLTKTELADLDKIIKGILSSSGVVLGTILSKKVSLDNITSAVQDVAGFGAGLDKRSVLAATDLQEGVNGTIQFLTPQDDMIRIADLMNGVTSDINDDTEINDQQKSAYTEAMNQFFSNLAHSLSGKTGKSITSGLVELTVVNPGDPVEFKNSEAQAVVYTANLKIEGGIDCPAHMILPLSIARGLVASAGGSPREFTVKQTKTEVKVKPPAPAPQPIHGGGVRVQPVQFQQFSAASQEPLPTNIQLLLDVPMDVTVELGRTRKLVRDILEFGTGSIIELDKLAGEPVDVMVNGKLVAKGEVVVIDENFGVRVTDIISQMERLNSLQ